MMNLSKKLNKEYLLKESKSFCMAPWIHMHIWPNGEAFPCCIVQPEDIKVTGKNRKGMANSNNSAIKEIWNCETLRQLRLNMIDDKPSQMCNKCYELENTADVWTLRKNLNKEFAHHFDRIKNTHEDGTHDDPQFYYWDIRFNNLCNMKCRSCGPEFSTSWWDDRKIQNPKYKTEKFTSLTNKQGFWDEIKPLINNIESVYFAGGEPLITDEHYTMLDTWLESNRQDVVKISYTTNFSHLGHKGKNVLDYWKKFKNVDVVASLDASYERAEWLRKGTNWKKIVQNRIKMKNECPDTVFGFTPTVSAFNVWHLPDFHREWCELGYIEPWDIRINILTHPNQMRMQILPYEFKQEIKEKWLKHFDWLRSQYNLGPDDGKEMFVMLEGLINFLFKEDRSYDIPHLLKREAVWDKIRNESMWEIFPELEILKRYA
jgi:MoaA/NifB/PqqE/SkfB family radical SAM enzyme